MTKKKRVIVSLDAKVFDTLEFIAEQHNCSKSRVVSVAINHLEYGLIEHCYYHISKKLIVDN